MLSTIDVVDVRHISPETEFGLIVESHDTALSLAPWTRHYRPQIERWLRDYGAIVFRDFASTPDEFAAFADVISPHFMEDTGGNAPRSEVSRGVYTSSELPPSALLVQHHEKSFVATVPMKLVFYCERPAASGGETPLCSSRTFLERIDPGVVEEFEARGGVRYIRNLRPNTPFKDIAATFGTRDRTAVEALCVKDEATYEWRSNEWLYVRQQQPAVRVHPETGERVFFATPHLWHRSTWVEQLAAAGSPYTRADVLGEPPTHAALHAQYADGTEIAESVVRAIHETYEKCKVMFSWRRGDALLVDNFLASHGRQPYSGDRRILASLREPYHVANGYLRPVTCSLIPG